MTSPKPLLLLDVDGVLNPFPDTPEGYDEYDFFPDEEPVRLSAVHGDWLRELSVAFDIVWATGWGEEANRLIAPAFALPELPVIVLPERFEPSDKVPGIAAYVGDRAAAWIDDIVTPEARRWARTRRAPTLLVEVDSSAGLTRPLVDELLDWAAALAAR